MLLSSSTTTRTFKETTIMMLIIFTILNHFILLCTCEKITLSNIKLPIDTNGNQMLSGETSVLKMNNTYYFYVNNWGECQSVDCCPSKDTFYCNSFC